MSIRRMDTDENRAYWASVDRARDEWEANKPEWLRAIEQVKQRADRMSPEGRGLAIERGKISCNSCAIRLEVWSEEA
jgi:hypothetical protein